MMQATAILLSWKRVKNVVNQIIPELCKCGSIGEIILWNQNANVKLAGKLPPKVKVLDSTYNFTVFARYAAAVLARNPVVYYQDDDLLVPASSITELLTKWQEDPQVVHGLFGRRLRVDGAYSWEDRHGPVPILITRSVMVSKAAAVEAGRHEHALKDIWPRPVTVGNGEDIVLSVSTYSRNPGMLNRAYVLPHRGLSNQNAISLGDPNHNEHRTRVVRACEEYFGVELPRGG
jgi:hypothetical protein